MTNKEAKLAALAIKYMNLHNKLDPNAQPGDPTVMGAKLEREAGFPLDIPKVFEEYIKLEFGEKE